MEMKLACLFTTIVTFKLTRIDSENLIDSLNHIYASHIVFLASFAF